MGWIIDYYKDARGNESVVLLHGFIKKTDKTSERDIEIAEKRMDDYINRYRG